MFLVYNATDKAKDIKIYVINIKTCLLLSSVEVTHT